MYIIIFSQALHHSATATFPFSLFLTVDRSFMARPTYKCFLRLLNNYIRDPKKAEKKYPVEIQEEGDFMTTICKTEVMNFTLDFLTKNGNDMFYF